MGLKSFLRQHALPTEHLKIAVSDRFLDENGQPELWELRALTEEENIRIKDSCTTKTTGKGGRQHTQFNGALYNQLLAASSVVYPDLKDAELQSSYGVAGETALLSVMLISGEYSALQEAVQQINKFDLEKLVQEKEQVKNS